MLCQWAAAAILATVCLATASPSSMRAAAITSRSWDFKFHLEKVKVIDMAVPLPGKGEVLVEVHASNINPVDHKIVQMVGLIWSYPHKLGSDLAGRVVSVGSGCERLKVGDEVWGEATSLTEAIMTGGTYAQYAVISESVLGVKPRSLSMLEAGAMPMVALTGFDALSWAAGGTRFQQPDVTVLVLGGSGGTGHVGIQLAKAMGAKKVITTCSSSHTDFVKSLGADQVIDYHTQNYYDVLAPKSIDVVYDCVGQKKTGDHALSLLKEHGSFVTLLPDGLPSLLARSQRLDVSTKAPMCVGPCSHYDRIDQVAALVEQGKLKVHIDMSFSLENITDAFNHSLAGHTTGKVAVQMVKEGQSVQGVQDVQEVEVLM